MIAATTEHNESGSTAMVDETRTIAPQVGGSTAGSSSTGPLPDDLLQGTARRLALFCTIGAAMWTIVIVLANFLQPRGPLSPYPWPGDLIAGAIIVVLLTAQVLIRRRALRNCTLTIDLGLGLLVLN